MVFDRHQAAPGRPGHLMSDQQEKDFTHMPPAEPADAAVLSTKQKWLTWLAYNYTLLILIPLAVIFIFQGISLLLGAVISTVLVALILLLSFLLYRAGYVKVFPKPMDVFNVCLYASMIPLAVFARIWLWMGLGLYIAATSACFMWATILLPCMDNFVMHSIRDRVPDHVARLPLMRHMALLISLTWAVALTLITGGASISFTAKLHHVRPSMAITVASLVLSIAPVLLAVAVQVAISNTYRKRMLQLHHEVGAV